jgi:hypothetical protein
MYGGLDSAMHGKIRLEFIFGLRRFGMPVIARYLEKHAADGFAEVTSIFRHDIIQFLGMLQSWMVLIEAEIMDTPDEMYSDAEAAAQFRRDAARLQRKVDHFFNEVRPQLYPTLDPNNPHILLQWEAFLVNFCAYAQPIIKKLERATRRLVAQKAFADVIEKSLGAAAGDDTIESLVLKPYSRLMDVLDAKKFDARVAELTNDACV